jgi:hypothetical protein
VKNSAVADLQLRDIDEKITKIQKTIESEEKPPEVVRHNIPRDDESAYVVLYCMHTDVPGRTLFEITLSVQDRLRPVSPANEPTPQPGFYPDKRWDPDAYVDTSAEDHKSWIYYYSRNSHWHAKCRQCNYG